jgi:hypothetical protein
VHIEHSAWPFYWGVCRADCKILIPASYRVFRNALDLYSPPALDIHSLMSTPYWVFTSTINCLRAVMAANFSQSNTTYAYEVKLSIKLIKYLYLWYKTTGKLLRSECMHSKGAVALVWEEGYTDIGILPCTQPEHTGELEGTSKSLEKPLTWLGALVKTFLDRCPRHLHISS